MKKIVLMTFLALALTYPTSVLATSDYTFDTLRGANFFEGHYWYGNEADAEISAKAAEAMHLNVIRINARLNSLAIDETDETFVTNLVQVIQTFASHHEKVIIVLGGYVGYDVACGNYGSFVDVQTRATKVINALKNNPAIFAWEIMNEAISGNSQNCDPAQITKAVNAMYTLVHTLAPAAPTTVSEAFYWWKLGAWKNISTFASFHWYPFSEITSSPVTDAQITKLTSDLTDAIVHAKDQVAPLPLVVGEFGVQSPAVVNAEDQAKVYQAMYDVFKKENVGVILWTASVHDASGDYSVILPDGSLKPAGKIVQQAYTYLPIPGDFNGDKHINIIDFVLFMNYWWMNNLEKADFNHDGKINAIDYTIFMNMWNESR